MVNRHVCLLLLVVAQAVSQCPEGCFCIQKPQGGVIFYVRCDDGDLTDVPSGSLQEAATLSLAFNRITTLRNNAFLNRGALKVIFLELQGNNLTSIEEDAFRGLTRLQELNLRQNNLTSLSSNIFFDNKNLTSLDFNINPNLILPHEGFDLPKLKVIILKNCGLKSIPIKFFKQMPELLKILLNDNKLTTFGPELILSLYKLDTLHLDDNNFTSMQPELFKVFPDTLKIYFSNNPLQCHCDMFDAYVTYHARTYTQSLVCVSPVRLYIVWYFANYCNKCTDPEDVTSSSSSSTTCTTRYVVPDRTTTTPADTSENTNKCTGPEGVTSSSSSSTKCTTQSVVPDSKTTTPADTSENTTEAAAVSPGYSEAPELITNDLHWNPWTITISVIFVLVSLVGFTFAFVKIRKIHGGTIPHRRLFTITDEETSIT